MSTTCPVCGYAAYVGLKEIECCNPDCRHFHVPPSMEWIYLSEGTV